MKVARKDPLKEVKDTISFATVFTLTVTGPATPIAGIILIAVSHSEILSSVVFGSIFAAAILGMFWWPRRQLASSIQRQQMTVHAFVSYVRLHPELLPKGKTEVDLELFRKQWSERNQMTLDVWIKQFSGGTPTTSQLR